VQSSSTAIAAQLEAVTGKPIAEREKLAEFAAAYKKRQSGTVLDLIYEAEAAIQRLEADDVRLHAELAADQIVDKADFFARLDLES
jgi:hypothetical protein